jgi:hypothetical protein
LTSASDASHSQKARYRPCSAARADSERDLVGLGAAQPGDRIHHQLVDLLGHPGGHVLDVDPALGRSHQADPLADAVHHQSHVELLADVGSLFDQQPAHDLTARARLVRDQPHAQDRRGVGADLLDRAAHLDAAALASPAGVDLRLHDPDRPSQLARRIDRLIDTEAGDPAGHRDPEAAQNLFALVFVDFHWTDLACPPKRSRRA